MGRTIKLTGALIAERAERARKVNERCRRLRSPADGAPRAAELSPTRRQPA
jgi:hypothetical protein